MATLPRPILFGGLALVAIAALWATGDTPAKLATHAARPSTVRKVAVQDWKFDVSETSARFEKPKGKVRNVFQALVHAEGQMGSEVEVLMKLPAALAAGEGDWAYTGMVEVDGVRLALLENGTSHQGGYVREGETWKKSRIARITMPCIVVLGPDGTETTVFRYNANLVPKPKPPPDPGFRPMDLGPALRGPIGPRITNEPRAGASAAPLPEIRNTQK